MEWFRFYHGVVNDPKVQRLPAALFKHWINILCIASGNDSARGSLPPVTDIAFVLRIKPGVCKSIIGQLITEGLLETVDDGIIIIHGWDERQCESDDVAARVRKYRGKKTAESSPNISAKSEKNEANDKTTAENRPDSSVASSQLGLEIAVLLDGNDPECNVTGNDIVTPSEKNRTEQRREDQKESPLTPRGDGCVDEVIVTATQPSKADLDFAEFYAAYPRKRAPDKARKAYDKVRKNPAITHGLVMAGLARAKLSADWAKDNGDYIPYPASWLNTGDYKTLYEPAKANTNGQRSSVNDPSYVENKYAHLRK